MKTPRETAIEILEWLNFDSKRCQDWVGSIAEIIAINHDVHTFNNLTVAGMTIHEIVTMKAKLAQKGLTMINWEERYRKAEEAFATLKTMTKQIPADQWTPEYRELAGKIHTLGREVFYVDMHCEECGALTPYHCAWCSKGTK